MNNECDHEWEFIDNAKDRVDLYGCVHCDQEVFRIQFGFGEDDYTEVPA